MRITVTGPLTHRCPFVDEIDVGTVELVFDWDEDAPVEMHALRAFLGSFHNVRITHEQVTNEIALQYPTATVATRFVTAGLDVRCTA